MTRYVCVTSLLTFSHAITSKQCDYLVECMCNFLEEFSDMHKDILGGGVFSFIGVKYIIIVEVINTV